MVSGSIFDGFAANHLLMTYTVKIASGAIPLPPGVNLPDGTEAQVILPDAPARQSLADHLAEFIGAAKGLPADMAENVDHYAHGRRLDSDQISETILPDVVDERSFAERYAKYIGMASDLPPDLAENHDHYLHGHPKKQP